MGQLPYPGHPCVMKLLMYIAGNRKVFRGDQREMRNILVLLKKSKSKERLLSKANKFGQVINNQDERQEKSAGRDAK